MIVNTYKLSIVVLFVLKTYEQNALDIWTRLSKSNKIGVWTLCRKATVQNVTVQKTPQCRKTVQNGRSAEMENVPIVLSSRVTEWHDVSVTTRNNQLNKQLKDTRIMKIQYYFDRILVYNYKLILRIIV